MQKGNLVGKLKVREHLENLDVDGGYIKIKYSVEEHGLNLSGSGQELLKSVCEHGTGRSGVIKCGERTDKTPWP